MGNRILLHALSSHKTHGLSQRFKVLTQQQMHELGIALRLVVGKQNRVLTCPPPLLNLLPISLAMASAVLR